MAQLELQQFMKMNNIPDRIISNLINGGLDSLHILKSINYDHEDWDEIAKEIGFTAFDKLKIKSVIIPLQKKHTGVVNKEENDAMTRMRKKIKAMQATLTLISTANNVIDLEINKHTKTLKSQFNEFHSALKEREIVLLKKLQDIGIKKKEKLKKASETITELLTKSKAKVDLCKSQLSAVHCNKDKRRLYILRMAREIGNISILPVSDPEATDNKILVKLNSLSITNLINGYGSISRGNLPILISLTDNNNATIRVKWKLTDIQTHLSKSKSQQHKLNKSRQSINELQMHKLRVGWVETNLNDLNNNPSDFDEKSAKNKEFNIMDGVVSSAAAAAAAAAAACDVVAVSDDSVTINIKNKKQDYQFRLQYWNGHEWSEKSNIQSISIKKLSDKFDILSTGTNLSLINLNSIIMNGDNQESSYLKRIISDGIHHYKFRIDKYKLGNQMIGIWNTTCNYKDNSTSSTTSLQMQFNCETYLWDNINYNGQLYGFAFHSNDNEAHWIYSGAIKKKKYGKYIMNGDIIEMIIDFNLYTLSFKINNKFCGKGADIIKGNYRVCTTLCGDQTKFTLLSYKPRII